MRWFTSEEQGTSEGVYQATTEAETSEEASLEEH